MINTVSTVAELSMYLPVPMFGFCVDRFGPRPLAFFASLAFGVGYLLAALTYGSHTHQKLAADKWPFFMMVIAFVGIGLGTSCMYLAAVTTCAKNFAKGKHKGLALAVPIASFGLSGMWQSQVGSHLLFVRNRDGSKGDVDVARYFYFLCGLLLGVGLVGTLLLQLVDEENVIDEAVEQLEQSGLLDDSEFFASRDQGQFYSPLSVAERRSATSQQDTTDSQALAKEELSCKKSWLLNGETRLFLADPTMWWLTGGFFLVSGPGEAFINNLGTIIGTLSPAYLAIESTSPSTHVSIVALASTVARIMTGTLSDMLAPSSIPNQHRQGPDSLASSLASLDPLSSGSHLQSKSARRLTISRMTLLIVFTIVLSVGQLLLASGLIQDHGPTRFWLVSALIGTGYGAIFSLVPIIISCVWGIENFGTNWGIVATAPAGGAAVWGALYAAVYQHSGNGGHLSAPNEGYPHPGRCHGVQCYAPTFWAMVVASWLACLMWLWAWIGPGGWRKRGIIV